MWSFKFDIEKAVASIKLILLNLNDSTDFHKLFKILYFAEQKHLSLYGHPIIGDNYVAMRNGPVPSNTYDLLKALRGDKTFLKTDPDFSYHFAVLNNHTLQLINRDLDLDIFSESELECLTTSIEENGLLDFWMLTDKSHDSAWQNSKRDDEMSVFEIAKAGGASNELIKYISLNLENERLVL